MGEEKMSEEKKNFFFFLFFFGRVYKVGGRSKGQISTIYKKTLGHTNVSTCLMAYR